MTTTNAGNGPLDEPQITLRDRSREYFWPVNRVDGIHGKGWAGVSLSVHHDRDGKRFWTSVHPSTVFDHGFTQMSMSLLRAPTWRKVQPVARYSARALDAFAERTLADFREAYSDGNPDIRTLFARPAGD